MRMCAVLAGAALTLGALAPAAVAGEKGRFGPRGFAGLKLGMSLQQARDDGMVVKKGDMVSGGCSSWDLKAHPTADHQVGVYISRRHGVALILAPKGVRTPQGVGAGSTLRQVKRAYPHLRQGDFHYATVPGNRRADYYFLMDRGRVHEMALALKKQDCVG